MLLAIIGLGTESKSGGQNLGNEAGRQQTAISNPVMGFFANLFNDTGSSNPVKDITTQISKQFDPQTYFSNNPSLLPYANQIAKGDIDATSLNVDGLKSALKKNPQLAKEVSPSGYSLLYFAILNINNDAVNLLLNGGADANQIYKANDGQYTPITYLLNNYSELGSAHPDENKTLDIIDLLDKHGAKLNIVYSSDSPAVRAPISYVTLDWEENLLKKLVNDGADINLPGFQGQTLLYEQLTISTDPSYIKFLLDLGADPNRKAQNGKSPADVFCEWVTDIQARGQFNGKWQTSAQQIAAMLRAKGVTLSCKI
ncbi:MAG: hypothetical protein P4L74_02745 [Candidatus Doudnabacteria bacterium]|nr:hypothetical protein [Candidatus Doudnabacteria bacterium]